MARRLARRSWAEPSPTSSRSPRSRALFARMCKPNGRPPDRCQCDDREIRNAAHMMGRSAGDRTTAVPPHINLRSRNLHVTQTTTEEIIMGSTRRLGSAKRISPLLLPIARDVVTLQVLLRLVRGILGLVRFVVSLALQVQEDIASLSRRRNRTALRFSTSKGAPERAPRSATRQDSTPARSPCAAEVPARMLRAARTIHARSDSARGEAAASARRMYSKPPLALNGASGSRSGELRSGTPGI